MAPINILQHQIGFVRCGYWQFPWFYFAQPKVKIQLRMNLWSLMWDMNTYIILIHCTSVVLTTSIIFMSWGTFSIRLLSYGINNSDHYPKCVNCYHMVLIVIMANWSIVSTSNRYCSWRYYLVKHVPRYTLLNNLCMYLVNWMLYK